MGVAIFIGGPEALGLFSDKFGLTGGLWDMTGGLNANLANFGSVVVGIFVASWLISVLIYQAKGYDHPQMKRKLRRPNAPNSG